MSKNNIFDVNNLDDLPKELIREAVILSAPSISVLQLFIVAGRSLGMTEILIAYYRRYKEIRTRNYMVTTCYRLFRAGLLDSTKGKGEYRISEKGKKIMSALEDQP